MTQCGTKNDTVWYESILLKNLSKSYCLLLGRRVKRYCKDSFFTKIVV